MAQDGGILGVFFAVLAVEELHGPANQHRGLLALQVFGQRQGLGYQGFHGRAVSPEFRPPARVGDGRGPLDAQRGGAQRHGRIQIHVAAEHGIEVVPEAALHVHLLAQGGLQAQHELHDAGGPAGALGRVFDVAQAQDELKRGVSVLAHQELDVEGEGLKVGHGVS